MILKRKGRYHEKIFLVVVLALTLGLASGCSTSNPSSAPNVTPGANTNPNAGTETPKENQQAKSDVEKAKFINKGEVITVEDFCEFSVENTKISSRIDPPNPGGFYTYYEVKDTANKYLDVTVKIKSLLTSGKTSDEFAKVKIKYNDKYEYRTFSAIEENGGSNFTYTNITSIEPLKTEVLHFLGEIPKEVEDSSSPLVAEITISGKAYQYSIR